MSRDTFAASLPIGPMATAGQHKCYRTCDLTSAEPVIRVTAGYPRGSSHAAASICVKKLQASRFHCSLFEAAASTYADVC
jgi:hypothetical protein